MVVRSEFDGTTGTSATGLWSRGSHRAQLYPETLGRKVLAPSGPVEPLFIQASNVRRTTPKGTAGRTVVPDIFATRGGHSGCPSLENQPVTHLLESGVNTAEASSEEAISGGFEPAKALVRGLPLPQPPSYRDHLGCLAVLRSVRGVGQSLTYTHGVISDRLVAGGRASCSAI